jgi:hypothetical protein
MLPKMSTTGFVARSSASENSPGCSPADFANRGNVKSGGFADLQTIGRKAALHIGLGDDLAGLAIEPALGLLSECRVGRNESRGYDEQEQNAHGSGLPSCVAEPVLASLNTAAAPSSRPIKYRRKTATFQPPDGRVFPRRLGLQTIGNRAKWTDSPQRPVVVWAEHPRAKDDDA